MSSGRSKTWKRFWLCREQQWGRKLDFIFSPAWGQCFGRRQRGGGNRRGNICASSKTLYFLQVSLLVKACPFVHSRNLLQQFSALFCDASVSHLQVIILAGALVCSYFSIIKALPWHLSLFHPCFQCPCACSFRPTGSWMYCLCSTCSFNLCFIWSVLLYFLVSFFSFF